MQAEAAAILWVLQLAKSENTKRIVVEGDAKNCFDAIKDGWTHAAWPIQTLICDILDLGKSFVSCNFNWVRIELSQVCCFLLVFILL